MNDGDISEKVIYHKFGMLRFSQHLPKDRKSLHEYIKVSLTDTLSYGQGKEAYFQGVGENGKGIDKM